MSGNLGLEAPNAQPGQQQNLILYPYVNPASEVIKGVELAGLSVTPISATNDGTQIWKITHNGVDTHPIHFHLFDVQLLNRVGWDGIIRKPDANELGWKDTVRISPLEDTIVALRPIIPKIPFGVPDSLRALNPAMPIGSTDMFNNTDALGNPISPPITNQVVNFGWEYVWHCHILSHEEMDMMRPMSVNVNRVLPAPPLVTTFTVNPTTGYGTSNILTLTAPPAAPSGLTATAVRSGKKANVTLNWIDNSTDETGFEIQRATNATFTVGLNSSTVAANSVTATQTGLYRGVRYFYRVRAFNTGGPSGWSNVFSVVTP